MNELALPLELEGAWEHALILTYGADLPFFERILTRQLPVGCRNRIILADRRRFLEGCLRYAEGGQVRTLNQQYVADGIETRYAMHAKLILLASSARGRLLVGSGNLGFQGYASGGELFTRYDYSPEDASQLPAFLSARQFLERLLESRAIGTVATERVEFLFENAPWLYQASDGSSTLWHNLDESFFDQIEHELDGAAVNEVLAAAPFFDPEAIALRDLIRRLSPGRVRLLVQPEQTSVNAASLDSLAADFPGSFEIIPVRRPENPYIHAKLLLVDTGDRTLCLQGSPNLSQVALTRSGESANIELANVLSGTRSDFDDLLAGLEFGPPAASAAALALSYDPVDDDLPAVLADWHLTRAEWQGHELTLHFNGELPRLGDAHLIVGEQSFSLELLEQSHEVLRVHLPQDAQDLLERTQPIALSWDEAGEEARSNPVFPHNLAALQRALEATTGSERLGWIGSLDGLDDQELERLLQELADAVVIDQETLWRIAGHEPPQQQDAENLSLSYEDIDYDVLREHPKLRQYFASFGSGGTQRSRLQLILSSIAATFRPGSTTTGTAHQALTALDESTAESEEELEEEIEQREQRQAALEPHLRRVFQNFIRRYLRGATTLAFEQRVGFEVMTQNYLIFSFILLRLFRKPWMPAAFLVDALVRTWEEFYGIPTGSGLLQRLTPEQRERTLNWLHERHAEALLIASVYQAATVTRAEESEDVRLSLRDAWRAHLGSPLGQLRPDAIPHALQVLGGTASGVTVNALALELRALADFETRSSFLASLGTGSGWFEQVMITRPALRREMGVTCLILNAPPPGGEGAVRNILARWMRFERRDYYRIQIEETRGVCFYDVTAGQGTYWDGRSAVQNFDERPVATTPWDDALDGLFGEEGRVGAVDDWVAAPTTAA